MGKTYSFMNKDRHVALADYDDELRVFTKVSLMDPRFAPPAILKRDRTTDRRLFNEWWNDRTVPVSRMEQYQAKDMLMENLGLSLSDCYWLDPGGLTWDEVNLFENGASPLSMKSPGRYSPDASTGGDLPKHWRKNNSTWELVKQGSGTLRQEPYNEAVAAALHKRLLIPGDYVPYYLENGSSVCPNMLGRDEELVTAWDLIKNVKKPNDKSGLDFLHEQLSRHLSARDVSQGLEKMFVCDLILANSDRHYRNFGLIRNVSTLVYEGPAPIFDSGSCLWYDKPRLKYSSDYDYGTKPFGLPPEKLLGRFHDFSWFDPDRLKDFKDEAGSILSLNPYMPEGRLDAVLEGLERNMAEVMEYAGNCQKKQAAAFADAINSMPENGAKAL